ncbi:MAG TPA: copper oxidase, partial [Phycisphaerales bacterium]|nr:copper oxidase [Phycisphaerales bacterium]
MSVSRRDFLRIGSLAAAAVATGCGGGSNSFSPVLTDFGPPAAGMIQPPELRSTGGRLVTTFNISYADVTVTTPVGNRRARLRTWNGFLGGPTLRVKPGDQLTVQLHNNLPPNTDPVPPDHNTPHHFNTINLHTHGLHVSPDQDNVLINIEPGTS